MRGLAWEETIWFLTGWPRTGKQNIFRIYSLFPGLLNRFRLAGEPQMVRYGTQAEGR
jgi:hypothetical protein